MIIFFKNKNKKFLNMKLSYRPEIDGLRAVAVCAVILYHAQLSIFESQIFNGGFIGVDIFFVISGYLITSIILKELSQYGKFSFRNFYERRIRRILPALLIVMLVSLPFAWFFLLPHRIVELSETILFSLGFSSNFYFHFESKKYGAEDSILIPFLHTWSLSVEEQFYIIFPIVLVIIFIFFKKYLLHIFIIGLIISLGLADWGSKNYTSFNFYILHARVWELLAGSILSSFEIKFGHRSKKNLLNNLLPLIGIILIFHSIFFYNDEIHHPSLFTLSPIIGVCLIIWYSSKNNFVTKILSTKLFVGIGLISYSLYLWHYPIFSFVVLKGYSLDDNFIKIFIFSIVFIISIFSYFFVEKPARNKSINFKKIFYVIVLLYLTVFTLSFLSTNNKFLQFFHDQNTIEYDEVINTEKLWRKCKVSNVKNDNYCKFGNSKNKVFLIGDSHMIPLMRDLGKKLNNNNYELNLLIQPGYIYRRSINDKRTEYLKNLKNSILIFGGYYERESKHKLNILYQYYKKDFEQILNNNNKILFLSPIPLIKFNPDIDLFLIKQNKKSEISVNKKTINKNRKHVIDFLNQFENIHLIDVDNIFCDKIKCYAVNLNKEILKGDFDHPSLKSGKMINNLIIDKINKLN